MKRILLFTGIVILDARLSVEAQDRPECDEKQPLYVLSYCGPFKKGDAGLVLEAPPSFEQSKGRFFKIYLNGDCTYRQVEQFETGIRIWTDSYTYRDAADIRERMRGERRYQDGRKQLLEVNENGALLIE